MLDKSTEKLVINYLSKNHHVVTYFYGLADDARHAAVEAVVSGSMSIAQQQSALAYAFQEFAERLEAESKNQ